MDPRLFLAIFLLLFISFGPDQQSFRRSARDLEDFDRESQQLLGVLRNTSYGDFAPGRWLNVTGFREEDEYQWNLLSDAQILSQRQYQDGVVGLDEQTLPLYRNPTSEVRGGFSLQ